MLFIVSEWRSTGCFHCSRILKIDHAGNLVLFLHRTSNLVFLHLFTELFCKNFSSFIRINCSYHISLEVLDKIGFADHTRVEYQWQCRWANRGGGLPLTRHATNEHGGWVKIVKSSNCLISPRDLN